ncbi:hypothetical protein [Mycobacterium kyorinense]|uniref:hypothetical protein n=1 Tax=Mycobacterium kyorinense TaxID=487514 RepID=UPI003D15FF7C
MEELPERRPHRVGVDGAGLILYRIVQQVSAVGEYWAHLAAPMADGWVVASAAAPGVPFHLCKRGVVHHRPARPAVVPSDAALCGQLAQQLCLNNAASTREGS